MIAIGKKDDKDGPVIYVKKMQQEHHDASPLRKAEKGKKDK